MEEKKTYEKPTVQKVEFDFKTRIAASGCNLATKYDCDALNLSES